MKCWKCGSEISEGAMHCTQCGALVKPTHKLMQAVSAGDQDAIIQLYRICYGLIYDELVSIGLEKQQSAGLVNKIFKSFIETAHNIPVEELITSLIGLTDHIGFTYMKEHDLEPHTASSDEYITVTKPMIDEMFICLHEQEEKKGKPHKKPIKLILVSVLVIALAVTGTFFGMNQHHKKIVKVQKQTYLAVTKEYVEAVNKLSVDRSLLKKENQLKQRYPQTYKAAAIVIKHKRSLTDLQCTMHDVDGDGTKELLIGYKGTDDKFFISGIYRNKTGDSQATNTNAISKVTEKLILTKDHQVIKEEDGSYKLLKLNKLDHYYVVKGITDLTKYLKKHNTKKLDLTAASANSFYKTETKGKTLTAYKYLPADDKMQKWLDAYQAKKDDQCNAIAKTMPKTTEDQAVHAMSKQMKQAYKSIAQDYEEKYKNDGDAESPSLARENLADLDGDGQVELIIIWADSYHMPYMDIYKFENNKVKTITKNYVYVDSDGTRMSFYAYSGHPGVVCNYCYDGIQDINILYLSNNKIKTKEYGARDTHRPDGGFDDYVELNGELENYSSKSSIFA